jgi:hypothetical protein
MALRKLKPTKEFKKIYMELLMLKEKPKPFHYKTYFNQDAKADIQKTINWINNNGGKLEVQFFRVPHDFVEMEVR